MSGVQRANGFWRRFRRSPSAMAGAAIVLVVVLLAIFAPWLAPHPRDAAFHVDFRARHHSPSAIFWLGTDDVGRDILSRILYGYRVSLLLVAGVLGLSVPLGIVLGLVAGYVGGRVESVLMGVTDVALAMPPLVLAMAVTSVLSPDLGNMVIALAALWWTWHARLIYSITRQLRGEDYIDSCRVVGAGHLHILFREILPNCVSAITVKLSLDAGFVILIGAALSFLGLGVRPPTPDLGTMVHAGASYLPAMWWEALMPGIAILIAILGFNLLGDGLRDTLDVESQT